MIDFLCKLWPYLAGGLIGWLLAGWFARKLKNSEPPVEKIVEKVVEKRVDNPQHLATINKLESENKEIASLRTQLSGFQSASPKTVDNPAHLKRISELESQVYNYKNSAKPAPQTAVSTATKTVDNPEHLRRINELEAQLNTYKNTSNSSAQPAVSVSTKPGKTIDNPAHIQRISELEAQVQTLQKGTEIDLAAAKAAGFKLKDENDLTAIEGIGPKINDLIKADGVTTFSALSHTPVSSIQTVLDNAGSSYKIANPGTWPDQANLAANNRWSALRALQDVLDGGVYPDTSGKSTSSSSKKSTKASTTSKASASKKASTTSKAAAPKKASAPVKASTAKKAASPKPTASSSTSTVDKAAAKAAGFRVKIINGRDDFTVVEGIGPKINELIHNAGINTYAAFGKTKVEVIQNILTEAGPRYTLAKPGTWPAQADMAAANKWEALKAWQDELDGGK